MTVNKLSVLVESSIGQVRVLRHDLAADFERRVQVEVPRVGRRITCTVGCAWCCHHPISISIFEGLLIFRWLVRNGKWTLSLREKLRSTADQQFGTTYEVWLLSMIPCPLLSETKECIAYPSRPLICRVYYSVTDPYYCHPHRLGAQTAILPREAVVDPFHREQERILRKHHLQLMTMPLGSALLLAEKIHKREVDLETIDSLLLREYGEKG